MRALVIIGVTMAAIVIGWLLTGEAVPPEEMIDPEDQERRRISLRWLGRLLWRR